MRRSLLGVLIMVISLTACDAAVGGSSPTVAPTPYPTPAGGLGHRPSTPVTITLLSPTSGEVVHGTSLLVKVSITGGVVTTVTTCDITPTKGHVHLYLDNQLIFMSYTLHQLITLKPGLYSMYAEFVAQDHYFFQPRDVTPTVFFTVAPG